MRRICFLLLLLLSAPTLAAGLPAAISGLSFSPDGGKVLVSMDTDGVPNAYALPVAGGPPVQLTRSAKAPVWAVSYFPADERVLYRSGPAGDEDHLFVRELDGKAVELVPGKTTRFLGWAADGALWVEIDNAGSQSRDLYKVAAAGYARTLVYRNSSDLARLTAVSPDGRWLAFVESSNDLIRSLRIRDLQAAREKTQMAGEGFTVHIPLSFSPDGTALLTLTDIDKNFSTHEFRALNRVDTASGEGRDLLQKSWEVLDALYSPDGKRIAVIAGGDTRSTLELYDAGTLQPVALPGLPPIGEVTRVVFSRDGRRLAFLASGSATPPAVWVYDLATPGPPSRLGPAPEGGGWVEGEVKRFKSFDGREIPGILYKPREAAPDHKVPAVVWIHDGPSGQSRLEFDPLFQTLVQRGYAVYAVNERGSSGYGRTFQQLDDRQHGMQDLKDCVAAKAMLAATGWVDPGRVAVGGVGFGGFLTLTALTSAPREFAAGVDLFGVSNWQRVLDSLPIHSSERLVLSEEMGHPGASTPDFLISPDRAGDIVRPLLIVQGARDTLAIPSEAADIAAAMKGKGRVVEEIVLPDAAHGLVLRADRERIYKAIGDFLDRNLKGGTAK
ncbi:MAG TPA: prolyl oligopeptidase family serine peptidase [Thermoanaerobaculia bacterium]